MPLEGLSSEQREEMLLRIAVLRRALEEMLALTRGGRRTEASLRLVERRHTRTR